MIVGPREIGMMLLDVEDEIGSIRQRLTEGADDPPWTPQYAENTIRRIGHAETMLAEVKLQVSTEKRVLVAREST